MGECCVMSFNNDLPTIKKFVFLLPHTGEKAESGLDFLCSKF